MGQSVLEGVKVIEYGHMVAAPYCAKLMADLGADVVKIEDPAQGDPARRRGPFAGDLPHPERSALFLYLNLNKQGITLDLRTQTGKEVLQKLAGWADVLVEDAPPSQAQELGLVHEDLAQVNPRLVMTSVTPFGRTGPYKDYKAYEINVYHGGGDGYLLPAGLAYELFPDREPIKAGGYLGQYEGGLMATVATLGALFGRAILGRGQHVDISLQEAQLALNRSTIRAFAWGHGVESRQGREFRYGGIIPCANGYVELLALEEHQWDGLVDLLGNPKWAQEERFRDRLQRAANGQEVNGYLREWAKDKTREWITREGQARRVAVGIVHIAKDIVESEHERARGFVTTEVEHPEAGRFLHPRAPAQFSECPWEVRRPAPLLGQHNKEVLAGMLGYSREDLVKMRQTGVI